MAGNSNFCIRNAVGPTIDALTRGADLGILNRDNILESDLRQNLLVSLVEAQPDQSQVVWRVEQQVDLKPGLWTPTCHGKRTNKPGGVDIFLAEFDRTASTPKRELYIETKWASGWGDLYDAAWDILKLRAIRKSRSVETCLLLAYVIPGRRVGVDPTTAPYRSRRTGVDAIEDAWLGRWFFNRRDEVTKVGEAWQTPRAPGRDGAALWQNRMVDNTDVRSMDTSPPAAFKLKLHAKSAFIFDGEPFELRVVEVL